MQGPPQATITISRGGAPRVYAGDTGSPPTEWQLLRALLHKISCLSSSLPFIDDKANTDFASSVDSLWQRICQELKNSDPTSTMK